MSHPRGVKTTAFGVFVKICWKECTENKTFKIKTLEDFRNQCSVWWYKLSPQEMSRFSEIAQKTNSQNIALAKAYMDNVTGLPTFDNQFSDIDHPLNYSDRAENSLNSLMKQSKQITRHVSDNSSRKLSNGKRSYDLDKTIEIKSKAKKTDSKVNENYSKHINTEPNKPPSKDHPIVQNTMKLQTEQTETWKNCLAIGNRVLKEIRHTEPNMQTSRNHPMNTMKLQTGETETWKNCLAIGDRVLKEIRHTEPNMQTAINQPMNTMKLQTGETQTWKNCLAIGDRVLKEIRQGFKEKIAKDSAVVADKVVTQQRISKSNDGEVCSKSDESGVNEEHCIIKSETEQSSSLHNYEDIPDRFVKETELVNKKRPAKFIPPIKHDDNEKLARDKDKENLQNCKDISDKFVEG